VVSHIGSFLVGMANFHEGGDRIVVNRGKMKNLLKYSNLWIPFVYSMALSGITLYGWSRSPISLPGGSVAFIAFFPMAFFFSAMSTQSHISRLEKRIVSLEKPPGWGAGGTSN